MKLIHEMNTVVSPLIENVGTEKNYYLQGIFLQAEIKNRNGRVYPIAIMDNAVKKYTKEFVEPKRAFGELGHPPNPEINLELTCTLIETLTRDGNNYIGRAKVMDTNNGKVCKAIMDAGGRLGTSSRGVGSLKHVNGVDQVQDDYQIATAGDVVADPSAPDAFLDNIMESSDWVMDHTGSWVMQSIVEDIQAIGKLSATELNERRNESWLKIIKGLTETYNSPFTK